MVKMPADIVWQRVQSITAITNRDVLRVSHNLGGVSSGKPPQLAQTEIFIDSFDFASICESVATDSIDKVARIPHWERARP
jgi:hypothetical protein